LAVIADSSVLVSLVKIGTLGLLKRLYNRILIPQAVYEEVIIEGKRLHKAGVATIEKALADRWIQVVSLKGNQMVNVKRFLASGGIGRGEAESLSLAMSRKLPVIIDDKHARELAATVNVEYWGTGAVLLEACIAGLVNRQEFAAALRELARVTWLSAEVTSELLRIAEEVKE